MIITVRMVRLDPADEPQGKRSRYLAVVREDVKQVEVFMRNLRGLDGG